MKNKINKFIHSKYLLISLIVLLVLLVMATGTYAWFTWRSTNNTSLTMNIGKLADVIFTSGNDISTSTLAPVYNYTDGEKTTFSINNKDTSGTTIDYAVKLNITSIASELKSTSLKYVLLKNDTIVQEGDFSTITTGSTVIYSDSISSSGITNFIFYLYIDGNSENNLNMMNKSLVGTITVGQLESIYQLTNGDGSTYTSAYSGSGTKVVRSDAPLNKFKEVKVDEVIVDSSNYTLTEGSTIITFKEAYLQSLSDGEHTFKIMSTDGFASGKITIKEKETAVQMITNLYNGSTKTAVTNNSITYQYDTTHSLMKDVGNNIRYYGASPNNYIYFNCSDYSNQSSSTCETWRIIGVFDGKVKLIRYNLIGGYSWDNKNASTGAEDENGKNNWAEARLMKLLNPGYESETIGGSLYYNAKSGNCYLFQNNATTTCNFTSIGIKNNTTRTLITEENWSLMISSHGYANEAYNQENGEGYVNSGYPTTWTGKIALAYPSDYGYAADLEKCTKRLSSYDNSVCTSNNWLRDTLEDGWFLTPMAGSYNAAFAIVNYEGFADADMVYQQHGVTPVLYLNSKLSIKSGIGASSDPYQLQVS